MSLRSFIAVQKPFISKKNISERIVCARIHDSLRVGKPESEYYLPANQCLTSVPKNARNVWIHREE